MVGPRRRIRHHRHRLVPRLRRRNPPRQPGMDSRPPRRCSHLRRHRRPGRPARLDARRGRRRHRDPVVQNDQDRGAGPGVGSQRRQPGRVRAGHAVQPRSAVSLLHGRDERNPPGVGAPTSHRRRVAPPGRRPRRHRRPGSHHPRRGRPRLADRRHRTNGRRTGRSPPRTRARHRRRWPRPDPGVRRHPRRRPHPPSSPHPRRGTGPGRTRHTNPRPHPTRRPHRPHRHRR